MKINLKAFPTKIDSTVFFHLCHLAARREITLKWKSCYVLTILDMLFQTNSFLADI